MEGAHTPLRTLPVASLLGLALLLIAVLFAASVYQPCGGLLALLPSRPRSTYAYALRQMRNPAYRRQARQGTVMPTPDVERFIIKRHWDGLEPFLPDNPSGNPPPVVLTLQCSPDRLPFVRLISARWKGPVSLAVFIPFRMGSLLGQRCRDGVQDFLESVHTEQQRDLPFAVSVQYAPVDSPTGRCELGRNTTGLEATDKASFKLSGGLARASWLTMYNLDYPVNQMRELARSMIAGYAVIFIAEQDFMVPDNLHANLHQGLSGELLREMDSQWRERRVRQAVVLPAFERLRDVPPVAGDAERCAPDYTAVDQHSACFMYDSYDVPLKKPRLLRAVRDGTVRVFHEKFVQGHGCYTPRQRWFNTTLPYQFLYRNPCEPYVMAVNAAMPHFDQRFRGRIRDKVAILTHMDAWGFQFFVNPSYFLIHLPHPPATLLTSLRANWRYDLNSFALPLVITDVVLEEVRQQPEASKPGMQYIPGTGLIRAHNTRQVERDWNVWRGVAEALAPAECEVDTSMLLDWRYQLWMLLVVSSSGWLVMRLRGQGCRKHVRSVVELKALRAVALLSPWRQRGKSKSPNGLDSVHFCDKCHQ